MAAVFFLKLLLMVSYYLLNHNHNYHQNYTVQQNLYIPILKEKYSLNLIFSLNMSETLTLTTSPININ